MGGRPLGLNSIARWDQDRARSQSCVCPGAANHVGGVIKSSVDAESVDRVEVGEAFGAVPPYSRGLFVLDDSVTSDRLAAEPHRQVLADVAVGVGDLAKRHTGKTLNGDVDSGFFVYLAHRCIGRHQDSACGAASGGVPSSSLSIVRLPVAASRVALRAVARDRSADSRHGNRSPGFGAYEDDGKTV